MPRLTPEQVAFLRAAPLGAMPNRVRLALMLAHGRVNEVADAIGFSPSNLSNVINGRHMPTLDTAQRLAEHFGCAVEDLFPSREAVA